MLDIWVEMMCGATLILLCACVSNRGHPEFVFVSYAASNVVQIDSVRSLFGGVHIRFLQRGSQQESTGSSSPVIGVFSSGCAADFASRTSTLLSLLRPCLLEIRVLLQEVSMASYGSLAWPHCSCRMS